MRKINEEADAGYAKAQKMMGNGIPVGAAFFDEFVRADAKANILRKLREGSCPEDAGVYAKKLARESIETHNSRRKDVTWKRWEGTVDDHIDFLVRTFLDI